MRLKILLAPAFALVVSAVAADEPGRDPLFIAKPSAFMTLVNPTCSHCRDEAKRRAGELKNDDPVLCWLRGYSEGGAIPIRFFLEPYRVISDSYGVFVYDPDAGYARGFAPSYEFRFHGWRNGVMVMRHQDGTLYSCLTGVAFDGPKKGSRFTPVPTLVADWGFWLEKYPAAVAYQMFDKYQPTEAPAQANLDSLKSRAKPDPRLKEQDIVMGVRSGATARAYPLQLVAAAGMVNDTIAGDPLVVFWEPRTRTAAAYMPLASPPRKYKAPQPGKDGVSPPDPGTPLSAEGPTPKPRKLSFGRDHQPGAGRFVDAETKSTWDVAGRCVEGELKGWTLTWLDGVQVRWFAWAAEHSGTDLYAGT